MSARDTRPLLPLTAILLVASIVLGGGTRPGFLSDALLQWSALPVLLAVAWNWSARPRGGAVTLGLVICAALIAVPLLQVIPLPPELWTRLPMRGDISRVYELIEQPLPWASLSVASHLTVLSALSLLPPLALFLAVLVADARERRILALCLLVVGIASVALGLLQLAQGEFSPLRFYAVTNPYDAVGFFANRNHFAALVYCLLPLAVAWLPSTYPGTAAQSRAAFERPAVPEYVTAAAVAGALAIFIAGEAMARSRAGLLLTILAIAGCILIAAPSWSRGGRSKTSTRLLFGALAVASLFTVQFAFYRVIERFTADPLADGRVSFGRNTLIAAKSYFPTGAGVGTFTVVYPQFPRIEDESVNAFANRAHNDYFEAGLESGVLAGAVLILFLVWYAGRLSEIWRRGKQSHADLDLRLARAASIVVALLLAHSLLDYPLRTGALMAVMAMSCAFLIPSRQGAQSTTQIPVDKSPGRNGSAGH